MEVKFISAKTKKSLLSKLKLEMTRFLNEPTVNSITVDKPYISTQEYNLRIIRK